MDTQEPTQSINSVKPAAPIGKHGPFLRLLVIFICLLVLAGIPLLFMVQPGLFTRYFGFPKSNNLVVPDNTVIPQDNSETSDFSISQDISFAEFKIEPISVTPSIPETNIKTNEIDNLSAFSTEVTSDNYATLEKDNFLIKQNKDVYYDTNTSTPTGRYDDWTQLYKLVGGSGRTEDRKPENSVFISSDYLLHVYHKLLEKEFEYMEQTEFYPRLKNITDNLYKNLSSDTSGYKNTEALAFISVAKAIIDTTPDGSAYIISKNPEYMDYMDSEGPSQTSDTLENAKENLKEMESAIGAEVYSKATLELDKIFASDTPSVSPIFEDALKSEDLSLIHDYTQYTPRSHYSKNPVLRNYFRVMMWYGRSIFTVNSTKLTESAMYLSLLLSQPEVSKDWDTIYKATGFFVGESDDLTYFEYSDALKQLGVTSPSGIDSKAVLGLQDIIKKHPGPQIMSQLVFGDAVMGKTKEELQADTKGFTFMGQRFTPDSFVYSTLTQGDELPDPKTGERLPSTTTPLILMSVLGNKTSVPLADSWIATNAPDSSKVLANKMLELNNKFSAIPEKLWGQNIYWGWLYTIKAVDTSSQNQQGLPGFMTNNAWHTKSLQTALGSYTELKHDTLLYAKQSYAEMGGGPVDEKELPPVPKGYVEPNTRFFERLIALSNMTYEGLKSRDLLDSEFISRNEDFNDNLKFLKDLVIKELLNETITEEEFEKLRIINFSFNNIVAPLQNEIITERDARSALIADIHTDGVRSQVLYVAVGKPNYIYVAVSDTNGTRLTKGLTYSYYEFEGPLGGKRLSDESWHEQVYTTADSMEYSQPAWANELIK